MGSKRCIYSFNWPYYIINMKYCNNGCGRWRCTLHYIDWLLMPHVFVLPLFLLYGPYCGYYTSPVRLRLQNKAVGLIAILLFIKCKNVLVFCNKSYTWKKK